MSILQFPIFSNTDRMHALEKLFLNRFLKCQIVRMHALEMLFYFFFSAVPSSKISFQIASDSTIKRVCFQTFLGSFNFQNIVLNSVMRHRLVSLILTFSQHLQLSKHRLNSVKRNRSASLFLKCSKQFFLSFCGNIFSGEGPPTPSMFLFRDILFCPRYVPAQ